MGEPVPEPQVLEPNVLETTETTPLLNPDDPKVSPLNLYKIQLLNYIVYILWVINCAIFFVLLLSDFVAIPGLNFNKSFTETDLIVISALTNLVTLWHIAIPSYYERILGTFSSILTMIDFIVVLCILYLRRQFGLGVLVILWTFFTLLFNTLVDYWVEQGKISQEIKYTGRPEYRRTFKEMLIVTTRFLIKGMILIAIWNISLSIWISGFDTHEKPWGKLVPVNNDLFKVHLSCYGDMKNGTQPIVVVEGGQQTSSEEFVDWIEELYNLNKVERYCIWDRPGYGFSDGAPSPISMSIIIDYLIEALNYEDIHGPFAVVGFDIGGLYAKVLASKLESVKYLMFVDSWHEDLLKLRPFRFKEKVNFKEFDVMDSIVGFKVWLKGMFSPLGLVTNFHWFTHPLTYSSNSRIWGPDMIHQPKYLRYRLQEQISSLILSYNEVAGANAVLTANGVMTSVISSESMTKKLRNWSNWQRLLTKVGLCQEWGVVKGGHFLWENQLGKQNLQDMLLRLITN